MGLRAQAVADAKAILEDSTSGFGWPLTLTSPEGISSLLVGFTTDIAVTIDPETGQAVSGRRASVAISLLSLPVLPTAVAERGRRPWRVTFLDATGATTRWKVTEVLPDRAVGVVVLLLEAYELVSVGGRLTLPRLGLTGSLRPLVVLAGTIALPRIGILGGVGPVVSLAGEITLPRIGLAGGVRPVVSLGGEIALPKIGLVGGFAPEPVRVGGAIALPWLALAGGVRPVVTLGGEIELPELGVAGGVAPVVSLAAATFALQQIGLAGSFRPVVSLGGELALPLPTLGGGFRPAVSLAAAALALQHLTLGGGFRPVVLLSGSPALPLPRLTGGFRPAVTLAAATLALQHLTLGGGFRPIVSLAGSPALPKIGLAGGFRPVVSLAGSPALPKIGLAGGIRPAVTVGGAITLPSLRVSGGVVPIPSAVQWWLRTALASNAGPGLAFTWPDVLNVNPATTSIDARKPTIGTSANGLPILTSGGTAALVAPLIAANNGATNWWIGFHARQAAGITAIPCPFSIDSSGGSSASARKLFEQGQAAASQFFLIVFNAASTTCRQATKSGAFGTAWVYITIELALGRGGAESTRVVFTLDGVVQTLAFANLIGTPNDMPTTMPVPTGGLNLLAQGAFAGSNGWKGDFGPNMMGGSPASPMAGSTEGVLTTAERLNLSNFQRPT